MKTAELFIRNLEAGSVWVNSYNNIPVNMPFGGYK
jgi:acyl-CoA reductase-like NAD-dependent aldehyde dehydrogenase